MKTSLKNIISIMLAAALMNACKKVPSGYLSSQIRYPNSPDSIPRGVVKQLNPVDNDGSSSPVVYELLDIRNAVTHKHADSVYMKQDRYVFTSQFLSDVDTTVDLLNSIRTKVNAPCFDFNIHTGALTFYGTTANVPAGTYEYDVKASNESGSKIFRNAGIFILFDGSSYENDGAACSWFQDGTTTSGTISTPTMDIKQLSTSGDRIILELVDKNGTPFNPGLNEYISRGDRSSFQTFARFHPLIITDTALICDFELTPFPIVPGAQGYTIYYRIPSNKALIDPGITPTPARIYSVNPRFTFRLFQDGTYLVKIQIPNVTRDPI
jgi:hypothetical protein